LEAREFLAEARAFSEATKFPDFYEAQHGLFVETVSRMK